MILVTGATGNVGKATIHRLLERGAAVRVFVRDKARLGELADKVEVVTGNIGDKRAMQTAMRGIERMYLHSIGGDNTEITELVNAARREEVEQIVQLSSLSASLNGPAAAHWFLDREAVVTEAGFSWTMLRAGFFMQLAMGWAPAIKSKEVVRWNPGSFAPIDTRDIGAVAAAALTEPGHVNKIYDLTGPEIMDPEGEIEIISEVIGRPIRFEYISVDEMMEQVQAATGAPAERIAFARAVAEAVEAGEWTMITDTFQQVTGQKPCTFRQWAIDYADEFR